MILSVSDIFYLALKCQYLIEWIHRIPISAICGTNHKIKKDKPQNDKLRKKQFSEKQIRQKIKKTGKNVLKKYLQFLFYFKLGQAMSEYEIPMVARGPRTEAS